MQIEPRMSENAASAIRLTIYELNAFIRFMEEGLAHRQEALHFQPSLYLFRQ